MFILIFYSWNFFEIDPDACVVFFAAIIPQSLFVTFLTIKRLIFIPLEKTGTIILFWYIYFLFIYKKVFKVTSMLVADVGNQVTSLGCWWQATAPISKICHQHYNLIYYYFGDRLKCHQHAEKTSLSQVLNKNSSFLRRFCVLTRVQTKIVFNN